MNSELQNPCLECELKAQDKNNPTCMECPRRVMYVERMGGMTHSLPDNLNSTIKRKDSPIPINRPVKEEPESESEIEETERNCNICGKTKPIDQFEFVRDGSRRRKTCWSCYEKYWDEDGKKKLPASTSAIDKVCIKENCQHKGVPLPLSKFRDNGKGGKERTCKDCRNKDHNAQRQLKRKLLPELYEKIKRHKDYTGILCIVDSYLKEDNDQHEPIPDTNHRQELYLHAPFPDKKVLHGGKYPQFYTYTEDELMGVLNDGSLGDTGQVLKVVVIETYEIKAVAKYSLEKIK